MRKNILTGMIVGLFLAGNLSGMGSDRNDKAWDLLRELVKIPGVSGYETQVADYIQSRLPEGVAAEKDEKDNVWFTVGEGYPHLVFVAHTDELGLVVTEITKQGTLKVEGRGGFFPHMYEGRPVVVHSAAGNTNGLVRPRSSYRSDHRYAALTIPEMEIYLGVSNATEVEKLGINKGDSITPDKRITDLTDDLMAVRAVDDRAGCAALLAAAGRIDWTKIKGKTITFAWDVEEEIGLFGARILAGKLAADYVFPIDTFVSSDAPLDNKRFACLPLGEGMVLRGIDSSSIAPRAALQQVIAIAKAHKIPFQLGNTKGGNDGSVFVPYGAADIPLSWPGVYSHSFIEKIHRKDLLALTDLITVLVIDFK